MYHITVGIFKNHARRLKECLRKIALEAVRRHHPITEITQLYERNFDSYIVRRTFSSKSNR